MSNPLPFFSPLGGRCAVGCEVERGPLGRKRWRRAEGARKGCGRGAEGVRKGCGKREVGVGVGVGVWE